MPLIKNWKRDTLLASSNFFSGILLFLESSYWGLLTSCWYHRSRLLAAWMHVEVLNGIWNGCVHHLLPPLQPPGWYFPSFCLADTCALQELSLGFAGSCKNLLFEQITRTKCFCSEGTNFLGLQVFNESFRLWMCHHLITVPYRLASCWPELV